MLTTTTFTLGDAVAELTEQIETLDDARDEYEAGSQQAAVLEGRKDKLSYWREGIKFHLDGGGGDDDETDDWPEWTASTTIELGHMTAAEEAMLHREMPTVEDEDEYRLWWVAASTEAAPYLADGLQDTFANVGALDPAVPRYLEAKANSLRVTSGEGNASATSSGGSETSETSTTPPDSDT